ncbi:MAG: hypothetical protein U1F43_13865 [Myxococcota bacterium]
MELTVSTLAKHLGATGVESIGGDARFTVDGPQGGHLKVSISARQQRFMGVLSDASGVVRCSVDVAPVAHVTEDPEFPGRVTLHVGKTLLHIDTKPSLAFAITTIA